MSANKQKKFPKLKKSLKNFLTDESGKITKKDALGLGIGATLLGAMEEVSAAHCSSSAAHGNRSITGSHSNGAWDSGDRNISTSGFLACQHASGIVNGHYSAIPNGTGNASLSGHANHGSHGSGHCSCGRGCW